MTTDARPVLLPAIIAVVPNGARRTQNDHPALPLTAAELVDRL
jgi:uncharacterized protein (DUF849 family)